MSEFLQELSDDEITEAQANTRNRGVYDTIFGQILSSGMRGVGLKPGVGPLEGKSAAAVKSGIENARKRLKDNEDAQAYKAVIVGEGDAASVRVFRSAA